MDLAERFLFCKAVHWRVNGMSGATWLRRNVANSSEVPVEGRPANRTEHPGDGGTGDRRDGLCTGPASYRVLPPLPQSDPVCREAMRIRIRTNATSRPTR